MVHNQFDCQPNNNSISMLLVNSDASLYECFTGDFFDQSVDTKEILSSLNSSVPLTGLTLDPVTGSPCIPTDLNGNYHGLENSESTLNSSHHHHQQQLNSNEHLNHTQQQHQHQHHMSHHHHQQQQHQNQHHHQSQHHTLSTLVPNQSPSARSSSSPSSSTSSLSPVSLSSSSSSSPTSSSLSPTSANSPPSSTTTSSSSSSLSPSSKSNNTTNLVNVSVPLGLINSISDNNHLIINNNTNSNSSMSSSNSGNSNQSVNINNNQHQHHHHHVSVNNNGGNCKYTDYIDGKFDGLMSTFWTMDISKNSPFLSELASDLESRYWESKPPDQWTSEDVWHWIFSWAGDRNIDVDDVQPLAYANMNGQQLCSMSKIDFITMNPKYGSHIYDTLNQLVNSFRNVTTLNSPGTGEYNCFPNLPSFDLLRSSCLDLDGQGSSPSSSGNESDRESTSSSMTTVNERQSAHLLASVENTDPNLVGTIPGHTVLDPVTGLPGKSIPTLTTPLTVPIKKVGRRGRPPKKDAKSRNRQGKGNGKLWEFIRDLLLDPATNPSLIRWERREDGVFKFVQSDKVAKLWGQRKQNPRMTYEKLSRAMRYYYKSQVLLPVFGRRLVYKFGPNATGWRAHPIGLI